MRLNICKLIPALVLSLICLNIYSAEYFGDGAYETKGDVLPYLAVASSQKQANSAFSDKVKQWQVILQDVVNAQQLATQAINARTTSLADLRQKSCCYKLFCAPRSAFWMIGKYQASCRKQRLDQRYENIIWHWKNQLLQEGYSEGMVERLEGEARTGKFHVGPLPPVPAAFWD